MKSPAGSEPLTSLAAVQEHRRCARCLAMGHRHRQVVERIARHRHRVQTGPVPVDPSWRDAAGCREGHLRTGNCTLRSSTATGAKLVASSLVSRCKLDPRLALGRLHRSRGQRGPRPPHGCSDPPRMVVHRGRVGSGGVFDRLHRPGRGWPTRCWTAGTHPRRRRRRWSGRHPHRRPRRAAATKFWAAQRSSAAKSFSKPIECTR